MKKNLEPMIKITEDKSFKNGDINKKSKLNIDAILKKKSSNISKPILTNTSIEQKILQKRIEKFNHNISLMCDLVQFDLKSFLRNDYEVLKKIDLDGLNFIVKEVTNIIEQYILNDFKNNNE